MEFILNDRSIKTDKPGGMTLLDFIRYEKHLMGTKIGCREGDCGACTVLIGSLSEGKMNYISMTSCITPLANAAGKHVVTIEGLNMPELSPVQEAFVEAGGTQCGFCTVGFIVSLSGYCLTAKKSSYEDAISAIDGNICRCTGYKSIERAAASLIDKLKEINSKNRIEWLIRERFIPQYFQNIPERLALASPPAPLLGGEWRLLNGRKKTIVGGGTDLYVQRPEELEGGEVNPFFNRSDLRVISVNNVCFSIGTSNTVTDLLQSVEFRNIFPELKKYVKLISSTPIRNMGTVGGNLVNASPIGDLTIFFLALNSSVTLRKATGQKRTILLRDFYKKYKTIDKTDDEFIETISFNTFDKDTFFNFEKVSKRTNLDIATVNSAIQLTLKGDVIKQIHISAGGVGPIPLYLKETSAYLTGKELTPDTVIAAIDVAFTEISPISDVRGSKEYKALLLRQLLFAHFIELFPEKFEMEKLA